MSSVYLKQDLLSLLSGYQGLLRELLHGRPHLRGSFHVVYTRCGKSNCWCANAKKGHPHARLTWSEEGVFVTRKVPASERKQVIKLSDNYRQFREKRRKLLALESQIQGRLDDYERTLTQEVRKPLKFLTPSVRLSAKSLRGPQVRRSTKKTDL